MYHELGMVINIIIIYLLSTAAPNLQTHFIHLIPGQKLGPRLEALPKGEEELVQVKERSSLV